MHRFVWECFGVSLCRSRCLTYLSSLGFAFKRPKKRLLKADEEKREAFVAAYAALREEAVGSGAKIFFTDEAHFRADTELRGQLVLRGEPALVNSSSPRYGERANYYSAVCLETGEVEWMELEGNSNAGTSDGQPSRLWRGVPGRRRGPRSARIRMTGDGMIQGARRPVPSLLAPTISPRTSRLCSVRSEIFNSAAASLDDTQCCSMSMTPRLRIWPLPRLYHGLLPHFDISGADGG